MPGDRAADLQMTTRAGGRGTPPHGGRRPDGADPGAAADAAVAGGRRRGPRGRRRGRDAWHPGLVRRQQGAQPRAIPGHRPGAGGVGQEHPRRLRRPDRQRRGPVPAAATRPRHVPRLCRAPRPLYALPRDVRPRSHLLDPGVGAPDVRGGSPGGRPAGLRHQPGRVPTDLLRGAFRRDQRDRLPRLAARVRLLHDPGDGEAVRRRPRHRKRADGAHHGPEQRQDLYRHVHHRGARLPGRADHGVAAPGRPHRVGGGADRRPSAPRQGAAARARPGRCPALRRIVADARPPRGVDADRRHEHVGLVRRRAHRRQRVVDGPGACAQGSAGPGEPVARTWDRVHLGPPAQPRHDRLRLGPRTGPPARHPILPSERGAVPLHGGVHAGGDPRDDARRAPAVLQPASRRRSPAKDGRTWRRPDGSAASTARTRARSSA